MKDIPDFGGCDATTVFEDVLQSTVSDESRSLWQRLLVEMQRKGVDGALSYLEAEVARIGENLDRELTGLEASQ